MINYNGRRFRSTADGADAEAPVALYRQEGDLVWAEFAGGEVRRGSLSGLRAPDGTLEFTYTMVLAAGEVLAGHCRSTPEVLADGRIRLHETWERYGVHSASGVSALDEIRDVGTADGIIGAQLVCARPDQSGTYERGT